MDYSALPGSELVASGLRDLAAGRETAASLLIQIGAPRLRALGIAVATDTAAESPEHRLYGFLAAADERSAHARYNALIRRLVSFERAAACAAR